MILVWLVAIPLGAGALAWFAALRSPAACRWISLAAAGAELGLAVNLWVHAPAVIRVPNASWVREIDWQWIPRFGIGFHLGADGLSLLMVVLTAFLFVVAVACSWREIEDHVGFFHFNLMWSMAGIVGVFLALDLFLFFFLWELMLVPMYLIIAIWGHENRIYSAIKFFIFTQASSLLMLASIVGLALLHYDATGIWSFDYFDLLGASLKPGISMLLLLGFFLAFIVKLPAVPLHSWLPDAHTDAPTAGSVILAGALLKTGAYGLIRFAIPLFPAAASRLAPAAMALAVAGILYGAVLAFAQTDFKRLVAYTSVSHLGFVLLGIFAWNRLALQGAVMQMIAHGISTGGLFLVAGALQQRLHTRDMRRMGGLWADMPRMGAIALFFAIASLGLPGLANFVGEYLVLFGAFDASRVYASVAAAGLVTAVAYSLILIQRSFQGRLAAATGAVDFRPREMAYLAAMIVILLWLGLRPQSVLQTAAPALAALQSVAAR